MKQPSLRSLLVFLALATAVGTGMNVVIQPGDTFKGELTPPDDTVDVVEFETIAGALFSASVKADKKQPLQPRLQIFDMSVDPETPIADVTATKTKASIKKLDLPSTGTYEVHILAEDGGGTYTLKTSQKLPKDVKKLTALEEVAAGDTLDLVFDASVGMLLSGQFGPSKSGAIARNPTLEGPDEEPIFITGLEKGSKLILEPVELPSLGTYFLSVENAGESGAMKAKASLKAPKPDKDTVEEPQGQ